MGSSRRALPGAALLGIWWGIVLFFSAAVPTALFSILPAMMLLKVLGALFPTFFVYASVPAGLALVVLPWSRLSWLVAVALVLQLTDWLVLVPMTDRAVGTPRFFILHGLSLGVDGLVGALVTAALIWLFAAPPAARN